MIYLLLGLIFIISIILAVEDFKTYSVSSILFYIYSGLLTILFWNLQFPFFFIPIVCLGLLFIKSENINGTDLYILCIDHLGLSWYMINTKYSLDNINNDYIFNNINDIYNLFKK